MSVYEERFPPEYWFSCYSYMDTDVKGAAQPITENKRVVYYDVETQKTEKEVGGWEHADLMLISVAVTYSEEEGFRNWTEKEVPALMAYLTQFDLIISFNGDNFDSKVLSHYGDVSEMQKKSFDVAQYLSQRLKHRIRLDSVAMATLGTGKSGDGLQAIQWFKQGRIQELLEYCRQDVQVLRDIVEFGKENGYIMYNDFQNNPLKLNVDW